jgi:methionyl-tRNA synthetase
MARFMRLSGYQVKFLTGTDEHGQKVEKSALQNNISPQEFTDQVSQRFSSLNEIMGFSNDDFIRTTEKRHVESVKKFWQKLHENGAIYLSKYAGWYSVRDEAFYQESELVDGHAPTGAPVEWVEEPSYFFNLSKWQEPLLKYYAEHPNFVQPESRYNEVISFVKSGLKDLSISRTSFKWGIPVPGDEKHVIYVWLDALTNYISALGYPNETPDFASFWPADLHIVGKDILRFHAVYWPAFLMAANLPLPKKIVAHGWWTIEGQKISKSIGNVIDPVKLVEEFGLDQTKYFLMREVHFGNDGNYSRSSMINRINSELANNIGNLAQRTLSMIYKNCEQKIPNFAEYNALSIDELYQQTSLLQKAFQALPQIEGYMRQQEFSEALEVIVTLASEANIYIDQQAPWALAKSDRTKMSMVLYVLAETIRYISILLQAFIPATASKMLDQLGILQEEREFSMLNVKFALKPNVSIAEPMGLFPRFQDK